MELNFHDSINVIVGINGSGKTSILDLLAILLSRLVARIHSPTGKGQFFSIMDIRDGASVTENSITIEVDGEMIRWSSAKWRGRERTRHNQNTPQTQLYQLANHIADELEMNNRTNLPISVYYSVNRAVPDVPLKVTKHKSSQLAALDQSLARVRNDFGQFFRWYRNQEDIENENRRILQEHQSSDPLHKDRQLEAVRQAIDSLSGFKDIRVRRRPLRMEAKKGEGHLDIRKLSDGEKCILALAGDLARRLAIANPSLPDALKGRGIILIDQLELHLHPQWQREIVHSLQNTFPNCQFIITTHSPQVIADVHPESVFIIRDCREFKHPEDSYGWNTDSLLEDIFDTSSRPRYAQEKINSLLQAVDSHDFTQARKISRDIEEEYGNFPELSRAQVLMSLRGGND